MAFTELGNISKQRFQQYHVQARTELRRFNPPVIARARESVQKMAGIKGQALGIFAECYWDNFTRIPIHYSPIEVANRLLFPEAEKEGIVGVHLASNYGPYVHFLREARGLKGIVGLDNDSLALRYAAQSGIPVLAGSADKMPFPDGSLDLVFSRCFLDFYYLNSQTMIERILGEVARTLKPGGAFISLGEEMRKDPVEVGLGRELKFDPEVQAQFTGWSELRVFIKV